MLRVLLGCIAFGAALLCAPLYSQSVDVIVRVIDQHNNELRGSLIREASGNGTWARSGEQLSLSPGERILRVIAAAPNEQLLDLERTVPVQVSPEATTVTIEWRTASVAVEIHDQHGFGMEGSFVELFTQTTRLPVSHMQTLRIPINDRAVYPSITEPTSPGFEFQIIPSIHGIPIGGFLTRREDSIAIAEGTVRLRFEWATQNVRFRVCDQGAVDIPGSVVDLTSLIPGLSVPTGLTQALPISDRHSYPTLSGIYADGYTLNINPGIIGVPAGGFLTRREHNIAITSSTSSLSFQWPVATVELQVLDQHGAEIPGSQIEITAALGSLPTGSNVSVPIADPSTMPGLAGIYAQGYELRVNPGINGSAGGAYLTRRERRVISLDMRSIAFTWHTIECHPMVLGADLIPVQGSAIYFHGPFFSYRTGQRTIFPVTDNLLYPTLGGIYANGYLADVLPGDIAPLWGRFEFEISESAVFAPGTFVIGNNEYSLACVANLPPSVDAGPNRIIQSSQVGTDFVVGTAYDPESAALVYYWKLSDVIIYGPDLVTSNGEAVLSGSALAQLTLGTHELTLVVSDGIVAVEDGMTLTIDNSPPTVGCSGAGTYQAGTDTVHLGGTVTDFDGDTLQWSWWNGPVLLGAGSVHSAAGGATTELPRMQITTGLAAGAQLGLGTHVLQLQVSDGVSATATCEAIVNVVDNQAPRLAPVPDRSVLWPPNHAMVPVVIDLNASDSSGGAVAISVEVLSSEDALKSGSGNTIPDFTEASIDYATGRVTLGLRAERAGRGSGRTYTIRIEAVDFAGNRSTADVLIRAPHDRGN